ncbi:hypothetical protein ACFL3T_02850 [Patescibacteria group bacterium]
MQNNNTNKSLYLAIGAVAILLPVILLTAPGCHNSVGAGDDSIRLRAFLEVGYPGDSWSITDDPEVKVTNIGPDAVNVQVFRFTMVADDDVDMEIPENCNLMYGDDPSEMVLIVNCTDIWLEQNETMAMPFPITGPWHLLVLTSIYAHTENGDDVYNDISTDQPPLWFNPNY